LITHKNAYHSSTDEDHVYIILSNSKNILIRQLSQIWDIICLYMRLMKAFLYILIALISGCASFQPKPLLPEQTASTFESRTLDDTDLKKFLEKNLNHEISPWPPESWDFTMLTLVAFYYHPDLDIARARWGVSEAGVITAGGHPNPTLGASLGFITNQESGVNPWLYGFSLDIPVETAGKRGYRLAQAVHLSTAARINIAVTAWQVRSRLRRSLVNLYAARHSEKLLKKQETIQEEIVRLLENRLATGEVSLPDVTQAHISLDQVRLSLKEAQRQSADALVQLASSLGLPITAVEGINLSFDFIERPPFNLPSNDIRRQALLNRADILAALSEYEATQSALQLEIARQYPNIRLGPGYNFDDAKDKWTLGLSVTLPVFNRNEGPIAEAEARRKESAAQFFALQTRIIGEIDRESAGYAEALKKLQVADLLLSTQREQMQAILKMFNYGEADRFALKEAQMKLSAAELSRLEAFILSQQSLGQLEDAVQRPLNSLEPFSASPEMSPRNKKEISK
jgi:cobalt-zinc-cadmium efflux system outer membrane protein